MAEQGPHDVHLRMAGAGIASPPVNGLQDHGTSSERQAGAAECLRDQSAKIAGFRQGLDESFRISLSLFELAPVGAGESGADLGDFGADLRIIVAEGKREGRVTHEGSLGGVSCYNRGLPSVEDQAVAATLSYPFEGRPEPAAVKEVAPGVLWIRMSLPFALNHINLWALEDGDGWTLVDTGISDDLTRDLWGQLFAGPLGGRKVRRLIVTHFHPDHAGLAGWLTERFGIELWMTRAEWLYARMLFTDTGAEMLEQQVAFYRKAAAPADYLEGVRRSGPTYAKRVSPIPRAYRRIRDGDDISIGGRRWRVVIGLGHAPEHACLFCEAENLLIAGDMVLPRISPNVSVWANEPDGNPLADFLSSLQGIRALPAETLVLPSHNEPFRGLRERIDELGEHHEERLDKLTSLMDGPKTVMEIARGLFTRPLDQHQTGFAIGETLSHLHLLKARGGTVREFAADGSWRYRRA